LVGVAKGGPKPAPAGDNGAEAPDRASTDRTV